MKYRKFLLPTFLTLFLISCGGKQADEQIVMADENEPIGAVKYVLLEDPLEQALIIEGEQIYREKCVNCHFLNEDKSIAPGWAGITNRREPTWIMNMILNVNIMLEVDSIACELLDENQIRMPEQHLPVEKARSILEFMRDNDLEQLGIKDEGNKTS